MADVKGLIICGFPGVGKSAASQKSRDICDCESTPFHTIYEEVYTGKNGEAIPPTIISVKNPNWVSDYVDRIEKISSDGNAFYVLVSLHKEVRDEMDKRGLPYVIVVPEKSLKDEYLGRYVKRGNGQSFIRKVYDNWDEWLDEIESSGDPVIHLKAGEVLADILPI